MRREQKPTSLRRGFQLITAEGEAALPDLERLRVGLFRGFLLHTSASLCLNENADSDVLRALETAINEIARKGFAYAHTAERPDDIRRLVLTVPDELDRRLLQRPRLCVEALPGGLPSFVDSGEVSGSRFALESPARRCLVTAESRPALSFARSRDGSSAEVLRC